MTGTIPIGPPTSVVRVFDFGKYVFLSQGGMEGGGEETRIKEPPVLFILLPLESPQ